MPEIYELTNLHSQQLSLLGYIQLDGKQWYKKEQSQHAPLKISENEKVVKSFNKSWYITLTTNASVAQRIK